MRPALGLALVLAASHASAVSAQSVRARLEDRVPAAALPAIDSLVTQAGSEGLPTEPLLQKALEGGVKGIAADRLVNGVRRGLTQLRDARAILVRAAPARAVTPGDVAAVSAALARGLSPALVERLLGAAPPPPPRAGRAGAARRGGPGSARIPARLGGGSAVDRAA